MRVPIDRRLRRRLLLVGLGLAAAGLLAACGAPTPTVAPAAVSGATPTSALAPTAAPARLNLNTATREQFLTVPNVGDRMVREFLEYRPYTSIQQFRREIGKYVAADQVAAYEKYLFVPVNPNQADAETLGQLPGVDATLADQLVAGRPYASTDAFLSRLGQSLSTEQVAAARALLAQP
jgi:DNA uptake protein ComE-like DNA-binding protein